MTDPAELELPKLGLVEVEDAETGELVTIDSSNPGLRKAFHATMQERTDTRKKLFHQLGIDHIPVNTDEEFTSKLHKFFQERARRYR